MTRDRRPSGLFALALLFSAFSTLNAQPQALLERDAQMAQLALEAASRGPATPIPLLGDSARPLGAVYDQYVLGVVVARQLIASGQPTNPAAITAHALWKSRGTVVVAYPIDCEGRTNHPIAIRWKITRSAPVEPQMIGEALRGTSAQSVLPGISVPDDALVVNVRNAFPLGASVEVDYAEPACHGGAKTATLPVGFSPSIALVTAFNGIKLPEAQASLPSPTTLHVRVILDASGRVRFPEALDGPEELRPLALDMLNARTFAPATTNGVPSPMPQIVSFVFTKTGERGTPEMYRPAPSVGVTTSEGVTTTTTRTFVSGAPIAVPSTASTPPPVLPPAPPGEIDTNIARLVLELAAKGDPVPVPLDAAGPPVHGVIFDRFLVAALKARAAVVAGKPLDASAARPALLREDAVTVAFPLTCSGKTIAAMDVELWTGGTRPGPVRPTGNVFAGDELRLRLPGARLPDGAIGKAFAAPPFSQNLEVRVTYGEAPCGAESKTLSLPIQYVRGTSVRRLSIAKLPPNSTLPSPMAMQMRGVLDLDGAYRFPSVADGPAELAATATVIAADWRFQPYRANGVPIPQSVIATLTFTTSGVPEPGRPPGAPPLPPGAAPPASGATGPEPAIMTSTTIGGRPEEVTSADAAGLTARSSLCAIANTSTYGFAAAAPIKTGGGPAAGPARERQYLSVLRGPAGQGLRIARRGSTMGPDGSTILDVYEIAYEGLTTPLRLYLDEYHDGVLQAPQGLVCAAPIVVR